MIFPLIFSFFTIATTVTDTTGTSPYIKIPPSTVNKTELVQLINDARSKGCQCGDTYFTPAPPLSWNDQLEQAALVHTIEMADKNFFSHISANGSDPGSRLTAAGYTWRAFGENIAMGYPNEKKVVEGWLKSPGHCKNIMSKKYKEMGVARIGAYWTQDFGAK
jgi:uncharacterized protein YkwD